MPKQYEAIRDRLIDKGVPAKAAKAQAARIYNSKHPTRPVGRHEHTGRRSSRGR